MILLYRLTDGLRSESFFVLTLQQLSSVVTYFPTFLALDSDYNEIEYQHISIICLWVKICFNTSTVERLVFWKGH